MTLVIPDLVDEVPEAALEAPDVSPNAIAHILASRIAGIGRGGLALDIATELETMAELHRQPLAEEYRAAAALLRREADARAEAAGRADQLTLARGPFWRST